MQWQTFTETISFDVSSHKQIVLSILFLISVVWLLLTYRVYRTTSIIPRFTHIPNNCTTEHVHVIYDRKDEFDVVLSYYYEDVEYVAQFIRTLRMSSNLKKRKCQIIVYNKNSNINNTDLNLKLQADMIISLPNLGREGETYLQHIIQNYYRLAEHTFFCQAGVEGLAGTVFVDWFQQRLENQFNESVGYMPMVEDKWMVALDCGVGPFENMPILPQLWAMIQQFICPPGGQAVFYRGQFIVSAKRIRLQPLRVYKYVEELITVNETHWFHNNKPSDPTSPWFGHVVERLWTTLFNCTDVNIISECRQNRCACYD